jgi:Uma2 family endonuclease
MSTTIEPKKKVTPPPPDNPWYYGWRDTYVAQPDGTNKHVQIPLTLEDCLHPQEGDTILESDVHAFFIAYLFLVFRNRVKDDPTALILSDTGIYWDHPELEHHSPDISVIFGIKKQKPVWPSFFVRDEGVKPHSIIELVSPNTRPNDVETKLRDYHLAEVPYYFIFDKKKDGDDWSLRGYQWTPMTYVPLHPDPQGRLWYRKLGLLLAAEGKSIVCYDGKTSEKILNYLDLDQVNQEITARAEAEKQRADENAAKLKELEAELARLRNA